ncbi:MAG: response regulator [Elusimicrobia bacterium]|nr:response regulator [Elusimicrobiota bacterium]
MPFKILVVDDDRNLRLALGQIFSAHTVLTAADGAAALRLMAAERPAVVLLDLEMPGMSGLDVLAAIKGLDYKPAVFMLTGNENLEMALKALELGAKSYITKPFTVADIRRIVLSGLKENGGVEKPDARSWTVKKEGV